MQIYTIYFSLLSKYFDYLQLYIAEIQPDILFELSTLEQEGNWYTNSYEYWSLANIHHICTSYYIWFKLWEIYASRLIF